MLPGHCGRVVSASTCQAGGLWFKSGILPLLKHACGESDQLLCWPYTPAEVSHQRWISGNIYHVRLHKVWISLPTLALKPRGDVTRSDMCPTKNLKKKSWKCKTKTGMHSSRMRTAHLLTYPGKVCIHGGSASTGVCPTPLPRSAYRGGGQTPPTVNRMTDRQV